MAKTHCSLFPFQKNKGNTTALFTLLKYVAIFYLLLTFLLNMFLKDRHNLLYSILTSSLLSAVKSVVLHYTIFCIVSSSKIFLSHTQSPSD